MYSLPLSWRCADFAALALLPCHDETLGMKRLSLRTLLLVLAMAPLAAFVVVCSLTSWGYYCEYASFQRAMVSQRLANAGGELALALPSETLATPDLVSRRRAETDKVLDKVAAAYQACKPTARAMRRLTATSASSPAAAKKSRHFAATRMRASAISTPKRLPFFIR